MRTGLDFKSAQFDPVQLQGLESSPSVGSIRPIHPLDLVQSELEDLDYDISNE